MNCNETLDLAPEFSFKPIETDCSNLEKSPSDDCSLVDDEADMMLPHEIFRESEMEGSMPFVRKANPIKELYSTCNNNSLIADDEEMDERAGQVISPYPYSHTGTEDVGEREELTNGLGWSLHYFTKDDKPTTFHVDYSSFFELGDHCEMMECDDFSVTSREANSISEDLCLENYSENPESFWNHDDFSVTGERVSSPTQVSVDSDAPLNS